MTTIAASESTFEEAPSRAFRYALWTAQLLLAAAFFVAGTTKLFSSFEELAARMPWVASTAEALVRMIGFFELAGSLGLIVPAATRIKPALTWMAAAGLGLIMVIALLFHLSRGEVTMAPVNVTLGATAAFVVWGRLRKAPISPR